MSAEQTIGYLHQDIATLNARLNDLWAQLQAAEDGSGITALRAELAKVEVDLVEARSERDSAMSMLMQVSDEKRELANRVLELEALLPAVDPEPATDPPEAPEAPEAPELDPSEEG